MLWRRALRTAVLVLLCALLSLAGSVLALRAAGPSERSLTLGRVAAAVVPAREGRLDVYVPVVDWGVRARPYRAPLAVELQFRSLDREAALAALRSAGRAEASRDVLEGELREVVADALRRAALLALLGGLLGGLAAGALVAAWSRPRWLALGAATGLAVAVGAVSLTAAGVSRFDYGALREPTFYARGAELPRLLAFSERLFAAGEGYGDAYDEAVAGLTGLIAAAGDGDGRAGIARSAIVASDLHSNGLVLPALAGFTSGKPVFLVGDLTQRGSSYEEALVPALARLGAPVVVVSGNHDSRTLMLAAARAGVVVLTRSGRLLADGSTDGRPVYSLGGLRVAGFDDPLESEHGSISRRTLDLKETAFVGDQRALLAWFDGLPERPDVVLVHRHALAHALLDALAAEGGEPVLVLTGHDHRQHVDRRGAHVLLDGGTVGAGGAFGVGEEASGFAQLHLDARNRPRAIDLIEIEPASGEATARRIVVEPPPQDGPGREAAGS
jgi:predicted phosphodiesterase